MIRKGRLIENITNKSQEFHKKFGFWPALDHFCLVDTERPVHL